MNDIEYEIRFALPADFDALYRARHLVYAETDGYFEPRPDRMIADRFDGADETYQVIAETAGRMIGGARLTTLSARGLPAFDYFDFREHLPAEGARIGGGSMFFVERPYRKSGVGHALLVHWYATALALRLTHAIGVLNPPVVPRFVEHGWHPVAGELTDEHGLPFVPVVLDLAHLDRDLLASARRIARSFEPAPIVRNSSEERWAHA